MAIDRLLAIVFVCVALSASARADSSGTPDAAPSTSTPSDPATTQVPAPPATQPSPFVSHVRGNAADALRHASGSGTLVTQEEIERAQPDNASEILSRVAGLQVRQEDQSGLRLNLGVRGLSPVRSRLVLVEEDGIPVVVSPYGEPELYYMTPVERIQSIDVVKGSEVLMYGPQTVGAVVKLRTWEPTPDAAWYMGGTYGQRNYAGAVARFTDTFRGVGVVAQIFHKQGDGFRDMPFSATDVFGKARIPTTHGGELNIKVAYHTELSNTTYTGLSQGQYDANHAAPTIAPHDHFGIQRYELGLSHQQKLGQNTKLDVAFFAYQMNTNLRLQDFDRLQMQGVTYDNTDGQPFFRNTSSIRDRTYDVLGLSADLEQRFNTGFAQHKVTVGVRGMLDESRRKLEAGATPTVESGNTLTDDFTRIFGLGAWIEDQVALTKWLVVTPAFRLEYEHTSVYSYLVENDVGAPASVADMPTACAKQGPSSGGCGTQAVGWMPGIGLVAGTTHLNVFTSLYRGYSGPRISQAITPTGQDTNLQAETSTNWELGLRGRVAGWLRAEADTFIINFDNQLVDNNPFYGSTSEFIDGGKTQHIGIEATVKLRIGAAFRLPLDIDLAGNYTFIRSRFVGGTFNGHTVPYSPANTANAVLNVAHKIGLSAELAFQVVGSQYTDEQNTGYADLDPSGLIGKIHPYTALDFNVRYHNKRTGLTAAFIMKNALNKVYVSDRLPDGIFTAGFREIMGTLSWSRE